jgi:hypothetical protein
VIEAQAREACPLTGRFAKRAYRVAFASAITALYGTNLCTEAHAEEDRRGRGWSYVFSIGLLRVGWIVEVVLRTPWVGRDCGLWGYPWP